jgi:PAS domain S-box-containing protein
MSAKFFASLANDSRLKIAMALRKQEMNVTSLAKKLRVPQAAVSKGLKILMNAGVVRMRKHGVVHFYSLNDIVGRQAIRLVDWHKQTGAKENRASLLRRDFQFQTLMDINPSPTVISKLPEDTIIYANPAALRFIGARSKEDVVGKPIWVFLPPTEHKMTKARIKRLSKGETLASEFRTMLRLDGSAALAEVAGATAFMFDHHVLVALILPIL